LITGGAVGLLTLIQFVPIERENPPVLHEVSAPTNALAVLERSCYDCHSNETNWPWYSYVAPISWLITYDVSEGRNAMNFSEWNFYEPVEQIDLMDRILEQIDENRMPLWYYVPLHPEAELTRADLAVLRSWISADAEQPEGVEFTGTR